MNEILNYSDIEKRMKGKRIPSRRELHSEPWDAEQLRFFCERQKKVPQILARMGITIVHN